MDELEHMFVWAEKVDDATALVRSALERVDAVGGAAAAAECAAAVAAVAAIPPARASQPSVQIEATVRFISAAHALAAIPAPGDGNPQQRAVHLAEIECAMHAAAARAQAARFVVFSGKVNFPGPLQPALVTWSCHWDAMAYHYEAMGRLVAGLDREGVGAEIAGGLTATLDTMAIWIDHTQAAYDAFPGPQGPPPDLDPELKRSFDSYRETLAIDREALAEWRTLAAAPDGLVQPPGRPTLARLVELDNRRAALHTARMEVAARINAAAATN
jgi:hypothetical protein